MPTLFSLRAPWLPLALLALACTEAGTPTAPGGGGGAPTSVGSYLAGVSTWPAQPADEEPTAGAPLPESREIVDTVRTVDENGQVSLSFNVEYVCSETPYSIRQTPDKIVMFSPDRDILWAGSLLQGKSHQESNGAPGSLLALPISERAPIQVSIPGLPTGDNFRDVPVVTQANVESAIGSIIGNAQASNLFTPATDDFEVETYNSEREFALKTRISGRYLGFSGSASGSTSRRSSETTIAVRYIQRLYEVVVAPPQTPGDFFTSALTQARLQEQIDLGRLGPNNQPVYVSNIVYGRMMMFTMTAEATAEELKAIVNASYDGLVGGVSASLSARQSEVLSSSRIAITTYGGDRNGTQAMIRSGDWREYFTQTVRLSDALPLSYTFKTLTGQTAGVSESTNYVIKTCQALGETPFEYRSVQEVGTPVPTPFSRHLADITGDGRQDLVLNHRSASQNVVAVLPGQPDGSFGTAVVTSAPELPTDGWAAFKLVLGDVTGNGHDDLVFSRQTIGGGNVNYVALGDGGGALTFGAPQTVGSDNWSPAYTVHLADLNGDGAKDLVWNYLASPNYTWRALSNGDGTFNTAGAAGQTHPASGWGPYLKFIGDIDADGDDDIIWNSGAETTNRFYHGVSTGTGAFGFGTGRDHPAACCWSSYKRVSGDFDGDQRADVAMWQSVPSTRGFHMAFSNGPHSWSFVPFQSNSTWRERIPHATSWEPFVGDVNGDGLDDVVLNSLGTTNRVRLALGNPQRGLVEPILQPDHPAVAQWTSVGARGMLVGDVNGDGRADVVWVVPSANSQVFVGLGRP